MLRTRAQSESRVLVTVTIIIAVTIMTVSLVIVTVIIISPEIRGLALSPAPWAALSCLGISQRRGDDSHLPALWWGPNESV